MSPKTKPITMFGKTVDVPLTDDEISDLGNTNIDMGTVSDVDVDVEAKTVAKELPVIEDVREPVTTFSIFTKVAMCLSIEDSSIDELIHQQETKIPLAEFLTIAREQVARDEVEVLGVEMYSLMDGERTTVKPLVRYSMKNDKITLPDGVYRKL